MLPKIDLEPPYTRHSVWHRHYDKKQGSFSFDAVEDNLGRIFVWDADREYVVAVCASRDEACRLAETYAATHA